MVAVLAVALQLTGPPQTDSPIRFLDPIATDHKYIAADYDRDVLVPLHAKQAQLAAKAVADAAAAQRKIDDDIARTRLRVRPSGTYGSTYDFGNCTAYVASRVNVPSNWGNANTWFQSARAEGWGTSYTPRIGAIATTTTGFFGHVALVEAIDGDRVQVSEMNYGGFDMVDYRWAPASDFAYIY